LFQLVCIIVKAVQTDEEDRSHSALCKPSARKKVRSCCSQCVWL